MKSSFKSKKSNADAKAVDTAKEKRNRKGNKALPEGLNTNLEHSFGFDFSKVKIFKNSHRAEQMDARAFTQGDQVHFAPGEFNPNSETGKNLIGHEFTHVVQQHAGMVTPTAVMGKGLLVNNDARLEQEADYFGKKAAKGEKVPKYRSTSLGIRNSLRTLQAKSNVIQRAPLQTIGGKWDTNRYDLRKDKTYQGTAVPNARGVDIVIKFTPEAPADAELIGLTQTIKSVKKKKPYFINNNKTLKARALGAGDPNEGTYIDTLDDRNNPLYLGQSLGAGQTLADTNVSSNTTGNPNVVDNTFDASTGANTHHQLGWRYKSGKTWKTQDAMLYDGPTLFSADKNSAQIFETTALAVKGKQVGTYYGSVQWGWETDDAGVHSKIPFKVINHGAPSDVFMRAANAWNTSKDATGADTVDLPTFNAVDIYSGPYDDILDIPPRLRVPEDVAVRILSTDGVTAHIEVAAGAFTGERGYVNALGGVPFTNVVP